jgi:hypothetical protein
MLDFFHFNGFILHENLFFLKKKKKILLRSQKKRLGVDILSLFKFFMYRLHFIKTICNSIIIHHIEKKRKVSIMVSIKTLHSLGLNLKKSI